MMSKEDRTVSPWRIHIRGCALLCMLAFVCLSTPAYASGQTLNGTFLGAGTGREVAFSHKGKPLNDWAGTLKFKLDNGPEVQVFCIQIDVRVTAGDRYRSDGPVLALPNGCQIRYLLDKYPASTATTKDEAAARQMAIWVFSDGIDPTTIADATVRDRTIALVNETKGKPCPKRRTEAPDLTIEPPTANAAAGQVVAYTVRASLADAGQTATVAVTGPAVLTDATGKQQLGQQQDVMLDAQSAAQFWVTSTGAGETNVNVTLPYRLEQGTVFSHIEGNQPTQRLVMAESQNLVANATAQGFWSSQAPSPSPTETPSQATETPSQPAATPAPPTAKPEHSKRPTAASTSGEESSPTPTVQETPTALRNAQPPPTPPAPPAQVAGGAAPGQPRSLPRTGAPAGSMRVPILVIAALLLTGWLLRRRAMR